MAPIVHGLERQYAGRIDFLYLDVRDQRTAEAKTKLGFEATPHFFLLTREGQLVGEWKGVQPPEVLEANLRSVLDNGPP